MSEPSRPLRDIEAEALRRERLGLMRPLWADMDEETREGWRLRADHFARIRDEITKDTQPAPTLQPTIAVFQTMPNPGQERAVRCDGHKWSVVIVDRRTKAATVEQSFTLDEADIAAGQILSGDPEIGKRPGLGRFLAAALIVFRLEAQNMGAKS